MNVKGYKNISDTISALLHRKNIFGWPVEPAFRFCVLPYLLNPSLNGITVNWFTEKRAVDILEIVADYQSDTLSLACTPIEIDVLTYSEQEESERTDFSDIFEPKI